MNSNNVGLKKRRPWGLIYPAVSLIILVSLFLPMATPTVVSATSAIGSLTDPEDAEIDPFLVECGHI